MLSLTMLRVWPRWHWKVHHPGPVPVACVATAALPPAAAHMRSILGIGFLALGQRLAFLQGCVTGPHVCFWHRAGFPRGTVGRASSEPQLAACVQVFTVEQEAGEATDLLLFPRFLSSETIT